MPDPIWISVFVLVNVLLSSAFNIYDITLYLMLYLTYILGPGKCSFGRFLLILSRFKRPQVMSLVKFRPTALNFGYDLFC